MDQLLRDDLIFEYACVPTDKSKIRRHMYADYDTIYYEKANEFAQANCGCYVALFSQEIDGKAFPRCFPLDMDIEKPSKLNYEAYVERLSRLKEQAIHLNKFLVEMLSLLPGEDFRWLFSGLKGFRVEINMWSFGLEESEFVVEEQNGKSTTAALNAFKRIAEYLKEQVLPLSGIKLPGKTIDTGIYTWQGLIRVPNSLHEGSKAYLGQGLYEIPLSPDELLSCSVPEILEMARMPRLYSKLGFKKTRPKPKLQALYCEVKERMLGPRVTIAIGQPHSEPKGSPLTESTIAQELLRRYLPGLQRYCPLVAKVVREGCIVKDRSDAVYALARAFCAIGASQREAEIIIGFIELIEPKVVNKEGVPKTEERKESDSKENWVKDTVRNGYSAGPPYEKCDYYSRINFPNLKQVVCHECGVQKLDAARQDLSQFIDNTLDSLRPDTVYLLNWPPGSGKTFTLNTKIKERGLRPCIVVSRHSQAEEINQKIYDGKGRQLEGRHRRCRNEQEKGRIIEAGAKGYSVHDLICKTCESPCNYLDQFNDLDKPPAVFVPQEMFFTEKLPWTKELLKNFDLVVFEESLSNNLVSCRVIARKDIEATLNILGKLRFRQDAIKGYEPLKVILEYLLELMKSLRESTGKDLIALIRSKGLQKPQTIRELCSTDWNKVITQAIEKPRVAKIITKNKLGIGPTLFLNQFLEILAYEFEHDMPQTRIRTIDDKLLLYNRNTLDGIDKPIVISDATVDESMLPKVCGHRKIEKEASDFSLPKSIKIHQIENAIYGQEHILHRNPKLVRHFVKLNLLLAKKYNKVLVFGREQVIKEVQEQIRQKDRSLESKLIFEHYWGTDTRGVNVYEDCDAVVLLGTPYPNEQEIIGKTSAFYYDEPNPLNTEIDEDREKKEKIRYFKDKRIMAFLKQAREAEMVQAINRIRPIYGNKDVYIISKLPLEEWGIVPTHKWKSIQTLVAALDEKPKAYKRELSKAIEVVVLSFRKNGRQTFTVHDIFESLELPSDKINTVKKDTVLRYIRDILEKKANMWDICIHRDKRKRGGPLHYFFSDSHN